MSKAFTIERNGKVIGAVFPDRFNLRIVKIPYHDPDRDGMVNGWTHAVQLDVTGTAIEAIAKSVPGPFTGYTGSLVHLANQLAGAVDAWNAAHLIGTGGEEKAPTRRWGEAGPGVGKRWRGK